ncbi:type I 3-dehydroquinase-domain-containing protein [Talaromyces proteolyticus]|uniref:Type I 3-dehydroquinase-domain-containing protein n=1 Tax=Talaromyces proteolyticus TaxID=1131652 RepID=A0AAD4Q3L5_9EURO|nr:type I 3-dehydroquinase-domain-containing protein [Talaromyces proteolyticus]KAH8701903.1 type I 3-dehydroquinase-domain-containing protein [Talaromyces proteolyticus]
MSLPNNPSIILIGCPGAGKRSLGFIGVKHLGRRLVIADRYFQTQIGVSRAEYLQKHGNSELQKCTGAVVEKMLKENSTGCILECGLASLIPSVRQLLRKYKATHPIIYISRSQSFFMKYLGLDDKDGTRLLKDCDTVHRACSNLEYHNLFDPFSREYSLAHHDQQQQPCKAPFFLQNAKQDFSHFLDLVVARSSHRSEADRDDENPDPFVLEFLPLECRDRSYLRSVRLSDMVNGAEDVDSLASGEDGVLLIVDMDTPDVLTTITKYISVIRRAVKIPIVYTVEVTSMCHERDGEIPCKVENYFTLLNHGLRNCVEYVVANLNAETERIRKLIESKSPGTKIIGSLFDPDPTVRAWIQDDRRKNYEWAKSLGCDIVQLTQPATTPADNEDVQYFVRSIHEQPSSNNPPLIAYNVGVQGRTSQIANRIMTPVNYGTLDNRNACDPQITLRQAIHALCANFVFDPLEFYLIGGYPSVSLIPPAMHRAAYEKYGFSHSFQIMQAKNSEDILNIAQKPNFGGASIMIPFKTLLLNQLQEISPHAAAIGAINTLLPLRRSVHDGKSIPFALQPEQRNHAGPIAGLFGDNTDWFGIQSTILQNLSPRNAIEPSRSVALIIGAGGGARAAIYAIIRLGCRKIYVYNRTVERAENVARHFNPLFSGDIVRILPTLTTPWPDGEDPATIIVSSIPAHSFGDNRRPNFTLPEQWLQSKSGGVVAELGYLPPRTPLLKQVQCLKEQTGRAWVTVDGLEILPLQAIHQFELMTGRRAPRDAMLREARRLRSLQDPNSETPVNVPS